MRKQSLSVRTMTELALLAAIEIILAVTPLGYLPIGPVRATTLHLPVIFAGMAMGWKAGALIGLVFGLTSIAVNTFTPTGTSFVFSPFITIGNQTGNLASLWIALGPRILLGVLSGILADGLVQRKDHHAFHWGISAFVCTVVHTLLVMGSIVLFFGKEYAQARGIALSGLAGAIASVILVNGSLEALLAAVIIPLLLRIRSPFRKEVHS